MILNLDDKFKTFLSIISKAANIADLRLFVVGGAVRDYFLDISVKDFDLILEGNAIEFASKLPDAIKIKSVHKDFGTVKLMFDNLEFDLASTRKEIYPSGGCLPVVTDIGVPVEIDVLRRDFTVNSMYFHVLSADNFKLIDLVNGREDIKQKLLKVLHNKSYIDDPTRILRGLAFKHRFGFDFCSYDKKLINDCINRIDYSNMSFDRVLSVFKKSLNYPFFFEIFSEIIENNCYKILTQADLNIDLEFIKTIISKFNLNFLEFPEFAEDVILSAPVQNFRFDNILSIYKTFSKMNSSKLAYYYYKTRDNSVSEYLKVKDVKLNITGSALIALGYVQGRVIGQILDGLTEFKLSNPNIIMNCNDEINWVKANFPIN